MVFAGPLSGLGIRLAADELSRWLEQRRQLADEAA